MSETEKNIESITQELYQSLIDDKDIVSARWDHMSLLFSASGTRVSGYRFLDDEWEAHAPYSFGWLKPAKALHKTMSEDGKPWLKMLMCLNKEKKSFTTEYEFEDADRWSLGGKDIGSIEEFAYSLKRD